ncbi:unnamed protein product [Periconia digitata]|uniref:DUF4267 domain-containing protein n=1 Tax=Periconia digitata TaxID=1303443 RepID=A0A9W4XG71_9PLEO|nr:unnamed protein product [Periconia digitata]
MPPSKTLDIITAIFGIALLGSGAYGVLYPAEMARIFGVIDVTRDMTVFYPGIGGRNFSAGLAVWALKLTRQRKALGIFLTCWICTGLADTYLLLIHYEAVDTVWLHCFNICMIGIVAPQLIMGR